MRMGGQQKHPADFERFVQEEISKGSSSTEVLNIPCNENIEYFD